MIVHLTANAEADLEAIGDYIARENPVRAASFVAELKEKCLALKDMPFAFPLVPRYENRGVRHRVYGSYQIFYHIADAPIERIEILHVIHSARDYVTLLFE